MPYKDKKEQKEYWRQYHLKDKTWIIKNCEICGQFLPKFNNGKRCDSCYKRYWKLKRMGDWGRKIYHQKHPNARYNKTKGE